MWTMRARRCFNRLPLLTLLLIAACSVEPDEDALRRAMDEMEVALEAGDTNGFLDHVTEDFSGQDSSAQAGELDVRQLRATLVGLKLRHERIGVTRSPAEIQLFGDRATIKLQVLATGGSWMPEARQVMDIESSWRKVDGAWQCFGARWKGKW